PLLSPLFPYTTLFRSQRCQLARELVHREHLLIAGALVLAHHFVKGASAGEAFVQCDCTLLGIAECVVDSLRGDRVLDVTRVADQDRKSTRLNSSHEWS